MQHQYCFEAVNRTLNDICTTSIEEDLFGNIPIILGGDFPQIALVVRHENHAATVRASLQSSPLWQHFKLLTLTHNMRVQAEINNHAFTTWLSTMSYDPTMHNHFILPSYLQIYTQCSDLIDFVYPSTLLQTASTDFNIFSNRCILAFHNDTVNQFNALILESLPGMSSVFHLVDSSDTN